MADNTAPGGTRQATTEALSVFSDARNGQRQKLQAKCVVIVLFAVMSALLVLDRVRFENLGTSERLDEIAAALDACGEKNSDSNSMDLYVFVMKLTGRLIAALAFFLILLRLRRVWFRARDSSLGRNYVNLSHQRNLHKLASMFEFSLMICIFVHMFAMFVPIAVDGLQVQTVSRSGIENAISNAAIEGDCKKFLVLGDDIFRITYFFVILIPLLYIAKRLMRGEGEASFTFTFGKWFYEAFILLIVVELLRHSDYPTSLFLIAPLFVLYVFDNVIYWRCTKKSIFAKTYKISDKYMLLFWTGKTVEELVKKTEQLKFDSVSRLYKVKISQYQMQLPYDLMQDLAGEYGSRYVMGFNNSGNMFSLGLSDTVVDEDRDQDDNLPFTRQRLLEAEEGVLKLNQDFMHRSRRRHHIARERNIKLQARREAETLAATQEAAQRSTRNARSSRKRRNFVSSIAEGVNKVGSAFQRRDRKDSYTTVDDDSVEIGEEGFVEGNRDEDYDQNAENVVLNVAATQSFDVAVMLKFEPTWDEEGMLNSKAPFSFGDVATIEQLNDYMNPVRAEIYGNYAAGELDYYLNEGKDVVCVATGGGCIYLLDTIRYIIHHDITTTRVNILFSTADLSLLQWFVESIEDMFYSSPKEMSNVKVVAALTAGELSYQPVGRIAASSAFHVGANQASFVAHRGSEDDIVEELPVNNQNSFQKNAKKLIGKLTVPNPKKMPVPKMNTARNERMRSNRRSAIKFRWGKVVLGRLNIEEKFKKLKKIGFDCTVFYQGGSKDMEHEIIKSCGATGFTYAGLHSFEGLQSMSPETPRMMKLVTAMESMLGSYARGVGSRFQSRIQTSRIEQAPRGVSKISMDSAGRLLHVSV